MTNNIDHYRLFKELISTFFVEFIELFFPQLMDYLDRDSITFLDKEVFTDVTEGLENGLIGECLLILLAFMRNLSYRFIPL